MVDKPEEEKLSSTYNKDKDDKIVFRTTSEKKRKYKTALGTKPVSLDLNDHMDKIINENGK